MLEAIFTLCAVMSALSAAALFRGYRHTRNRLLLWSAMCFVVLAVSNGFLFVDLVVFPQVDLHGPSWRSFLRAIAGSTLLYGLIMEVP